VLLDEPFAPVLISVMSSSRTPCSLNAWWSFRSATMPGLSLILNRISSSAMGEVCRKTTTATTDCTSKNVE